MVEGILVIFWVAKNPSLLCSLNNSHFAFSYMLHSPLYMGPLSFSLYFFFYAWHTQHSIHIYIFVSCNINITFNKNFKHSDLKFVIIMRRAYREKSAHKSAAWIPWKLPLNLNDNDCLTRLEGLPFSGVVCSEIQMEHSKVAVSFGKTLVLGVELSSIQDGFKLSRYSKLITARFFYSITKPGR